MPLELSYQVNNYMSDPHIGEHTAPFSPLAHDDPSWQRADVPAGAGVKVLSFLAVLIQKYKY